jgi:hypothetical protein
LGRQPIEANDDRRVATIFVASHVLGPAGKSAFHDLLSDMEHEQRARYDKAIRLRWPDLFRDRERQEWEQMLLALADQNIERLNAKLEVHEENADARAEQTIALLGFDHSPEGEALRKHLIKCSNTLFRGMANYRKYQSENKSRPSLQEGTAPPGRIYDFRSARGDFPASHSERSPEAHVSNGSELGADDPFGSGADHDDPLDWARVIDPGSVVQHGDQIIGMSEIGENSTNEANFEETMGIAEVQEPIQITASLGALPGLDNAVSQRGKGSTVEEAEDPRSDSASGADNLPAPLRRTGSGNCADVGQPFQADVGLESLTYDKATSHADVGLDRPQCGLTTPTSSDRASREILSARVSKREKRQLRREKERRAVEMMVEDKLKAGNFSLDDILTTAMTMALPGDRGP